VKSIAALALSAGLVLATGCGSASPSAATIQFPKQAVAAGATEETATSGSDSSATTASTAKVNYGDTVTIDRSEFEKELKALHDNKQLQAASGGSGLTGAGKNTLDPRLASGWLTFVIQDKLVSHEVDRRRLQVIPAHTEAAKAQMATQFGTEEAVAAFPKWFQERLIERNSRAVALQAALGGVDLSEDSLRKYYDEHKADFSLNCVSHILVRSKAEADSTLTRLKGGEDFATVAKAVSLDKGTVPNGGDLDCSPKGAFVPEFDQAASELEVGKLSDPVQTQYGFHILRVRERKETSFEESEDQIRTLLNAQSQTAYRQFLRQSLSSIRVTIDKRYGTFEPPAPGQVPVVVPPQPPQPKTQRSDTGTPPSVPEFPGAPSGTPGDPNQPGG
jgi:foldase protein PrsA